MRLSIDYDLHIHSNLSLCAKPEMTFENIGSVARSRGFGVIGVCDHIDVVGDRDRERKVLGNLDLARRAAEANGLRILVGSEVTMLAPGKLAISADTARKLDYISVATNHYHLVGVELPSDRTSRGCASHHLAMLESVCELERADILVHPFISGFMRNVDFDQEEFFRAIDEERLRAVLARLAGRGIRLELNLRVPAERTDFFRRIIQMGREVGVRFTVGSDAHGLSEACFGDFLGVGEALAELGAAQDDVVLSPSWITGCSL
jgi:histidinol phosphatase-like PHP family hydrolase